MTKAPIPWNKILWLIKHAGAIIQFIEHVLTIKFKDGVDADEMHTFLTAAEQLQGKLAKPETVTA